MCTLCFGSFHRFYGFLSTALTLTPHFGSSPSSSLLPQRARAFAGSTVPKRLLAYLILSPHCLWFFFFPGASLQVPHLSPVDEPQTLLSSQQEAPHLGIWGLRAWVPAGWGRLHGCSELRSCVVDGRSLHIRELGRATGVGIPACRAFRAQGRQQWQSALSRALQVLTPIPGGPSWDR